MLSDTLRHFCRNIKEIKSVDGVPMEKNRIEVNIDDLKQKYNELDNTHTQCVFHIIRLRLIIFHTPKYFHGRNKIE